ncbi:MAG TPA: hypothetical protein VHX86_11080 [Tepidisphaeraceae bacterium]|jgi:hypothetical protein|nr:hypothetical protein [Tepidisphaeraceae bacterium]
MADAILNDPLGRQFILRDHPWHGHILRRHPEMRPHRSLVEDALHKPIEIRYSDADPDCRLYLGTGPGVGMMVAVIADVSRGFVKTAHVVKKAKGVIEWSRPTP